MTNNELLKLYKKNHDKEIKDEIIVNNVELVKIIAGRLYSSYNSSVDYDDIVSYGILGLIDAIDKFDVTKNVKFETYANFRIRGSIIDHLRNLDWVPRSTRKKYKMFEEASSKLQQTYGFDYDDSLLADELKMTKDELYSFMNEVSIFSIVSLDEKISEGHGFSLADDDYDVKPELKYIKTETRGVLKEVIENLPEREKIIVQLYYFSEMTYKEISKTLSISESRVSQLHTKSMIRLRNALNKLYEN